VSEESVFAPVADAAIEAVSEGLSVHVAGPPGSGRSALLGIIAGRLEDDGRDVLRLYANPAWGGEPYAVLAAAGVGPANAPGARRSAGEMSAALDRRLGAARTIVAVDDADELDPFSAGALLSARRRRDLVAVTTSRPRSPAGLGELALGFSPSVRLRPPVLDIDQVHTVSREILGGPVAPSALARITMKSGGLPGLARAIVSAGRMAGVLRERDGIWVMPDGPWCDELGAAAGPFLTGAGTDDWYGATVLAVAGPLRLEDAEKLIGDEVLGRLFSLGLAHDSAGHQTGIYPPLLADYLRREGPPLARARAAGAAGRDIAEEPRTGADAAVHNQRAVYDAAGDVIRLTGDWEAGPGPDTAMPLLIAMRDAGVPARQVEQVMTATPADDSFATARVHSWYATWKAADQGDLNGALAALDDIARKLPGYRDFFEVTRAHVTFLRDRVPDLSHLGRGDSPRTELLRVLRAELLLAAGKTGQALRLLRGFRPHGRVARGQARLLGALGAVLAGDLDAGAAQAHQDLPSSGDPGLVQARAYITGLALGLSGRLAEGSEVLFGALSSATVASYHDPYHAGVLVLSGIIALIQGRTEYARVLAAQAAAADAGGHGPYPSMDHHGLTSALGDDALDLWPLVDERIDRGYLASAVFLAADAVERAADPARAAGVRGLAPGLEGRLLPALAGYVSAAAAGDEAALADAARDLAAAGAVLYAVRAEVSLCLLLRRAGRAEEAAGLAERAWHRSGVVALDRAGLFARLRADAGLSPREREILALAAGRRTTAEIAGALTMSPRTVETHLHNISRKAGVHGRGMLVRAGTTWLREPQW